MTRPIAAPATATMVAPRLSITPAGIGFMGLVSPVAIGIGHVVESPDGGLEAEHREPQQPGLDE